MEKRDLQVGIHPRKVNVRIQSPIAVSKLGMYLHWSYKLEKNIPQNQASWGAGGTHVYTVYISSQLNSKEISKLLNAKFLAEN